MEGVLAVPFRDARRRAPPWGKGDTTSGHRGDEEEGVAMDQTMDDPN